MSEPILITPPASEPVSLAEARLHLRIDDANTAEDALITGMIVGARMQAEFLTSRRLITQTWDVPYDAFPEAGESIRVAPNLAPVQSITQVAYIDSASVVQTIASTNYILDAQALPGYVFPVSGYSWPTNIADSANALKIRIVCGYGNAASDVPWSIRQWMLLHIGVLYSSREAFSIGQPVAELPNRFTDALLDPFRVYVWQP